RSLREEVEAGAQRRLRVRGLAPRPPSERPLGSRCPKSPSFVFSALPRPPPAPARKSSRPLPAKGGERLRRTLPHDQVLAPNFSCNAGNNRSGLNGTAVKRMPVASASALPSAAATGLYGLSLIDLAPIGPSVSVVSAKKTSVRGISAKDGR